MVLAVAGAGCGGGGGSGPTGGPPPPPPTPTPTPPSASATIDATQTAWQNLASIAGFSGRVLLSGQNVPPGTTVTATTSAAAPAGVPPLPAFGQSTFVPQPLIYVSLSTSASYLLNAQPNFELTLPSSAGVATGYSLQYLLADPSQQPVTWQYARLPGLTLPSTPNYFEFIGEPTFTQLLAGKPLVCAFAAVPVIAATPPSFQFVGSTTTGTFTLSEPQYSGPFTVSSDTPSVATVSQNPDGSYTVTGHAVGFANIHVTDSRGLTTAVSVSVTSIGVGVS